MAEGRYLIKVIFQEKFEAANSHLPNPEDWVADEAWQFLTEAGQPLEFLDYGLAKSACDMLFCDWEAARRGLDAGDVYSDAPIAWKIVELTDKAEVTWRT